MKTLDYLLKRFGITEYSSSSRPLEIPDVGRDQLADIFCELGFNIGAEVGVCRGDYSEVLLKANPNLILFSIDAWDAKAYSPDTKGWSEDQEGYDRNYKAAIERLSKYPNCNIIKDYSLNAVKGFADCSLDFVYLDAGHDFQNVTNDIVEWSKKVRNGGIISGHDYVYFDLDANIHVKQVVNAYVHAYQIRPLFILGDTEMIEGKVRDKYRSWLWVKK